MKCNETRSVKVMVLLHYQGFTDLYTDKKITQILSSYYVSQVVPQVKLASYHKLRDLELTENSML